MPLNNTDFDPTKKYKIKLGNGNVLSDLIMNGNNFVSETEITEEDFAGGLYSVDIVKKDSNGETEEFHYSDLKLLGLNHMIHVPGISDGWYFVLSEMTEQEKFYAKVMSDMEYLAMMSDVEL